MAEESGGDKEGGGGGERIEETYPRAREAHVICIHKLYTGYRRGCGFNARFGGEIGVTYINNYHIRRKV